MARQEALNNSQHQDLRVRTGYGAEFGDAVNLARIFPPEFGAAQRDYPILFRKAEDGTLFPVALLGFDRDENVFLREGRWEASYVPAIHRRGPFLIGFAQGNDGSAEEPVVMIDRDHPRTSEEAGERVFKEHGGNTAYFDMILHTLNVLKTGTDQLPAMIDAFTKAALIEPIDVTIEAADGRQYRLPDFHAVSAERLDGLDAGGIATLHQSGFLGHAYYALASLGAIHALIDRKTRGSASR